MRLLPRIIIIKLKYRYIIIDNFRNISIISFRDKYDKNYILIHFYSLLLLSQRYLKSTRNKILNKKKTGIPVYLSTAIIIDLSICLFLPTNLYIYIYILLIKRIGEIILDSMKSTSRIVKSGFQKNQERKKRKVSGERTYSRKEREERTRARGLKSYLSLGGGHNSPGLFPSRARSPTGIF